ncbi:DUF58 domain-containing protein [Ammoniphilus sp. YIM 78166]|uniref:DUF58 domain-containing protein n=1 Tax=Ammoniphilus sp. YIM 78166 TaxID=1644106 RepID=UPI00106FC42E|nr:DUF58 domain-containing protein [Ammoniphilus sp. YIM 78166]
MNGLANLIFLLILAFLAYLYKGWHTGFASTFIFYILFTLSIYETIVYLAAFYRIEVERMISKKRLQAGNAQEITLRIKRKLPIPLLWYAAYESWPGNVSPISGQVVFPWFKKEIELTFEVPHMKRGIYELTEIQVICGDLFGLIKRRTVIQRQDAFLVYPRHDLLQKWTVKDGQMNGHASMARRRSDESTAVVGIREYAHGDRLSQIHWKASAKSQSLKTKEFEYQVSNHLVVFLDTDRMVYPHNAHFEKAVRVAASLLYLAHKRQLRYALCLEGTEGKAKVLEGVQDFDFYRLLEHLASLQAEGDVAVSTLLKQSLPQLPRGAHIAVVTAKVDRSLSMLLLELTSRKTRVELFLSGKESMDKHNPWLKKLQGSGVILHRELA